MAKRIVEVVYGGLHDIRLQFDAVDRVVSADGDILFNLHTGPPEQRVHIATFYCSAPVSGGRNFLIFYVPDGYGKTISQSVTLPKPAALKLRRKLERL